MSAWLGKESSEYTLRIRSVYLNDPDAALKMVWVRLRKCYSASEVIEKTLFSKLKKCTKISNRYHLKLRELGDLLRELLAAKTDIYLPRLACLDTASTQLQRSCPTPSKKDGSPSAPNSKKTATCGFPHFLSL